MAKKKSTKPVVLPVQKRTARWIRQARGAVRCGHVVDAHLTCRAAAPDKLNEWCVGCLLAEAVSTITHSTAVVPREGTRQYECAYCGGNCSREMHGGWSIEHLAHCQQLEGVPDCEAYQP